MDYRSSEALLVFALLDGYHARHMRGFAKKWKAPFTLISGGAKGADSVAHYWAYNSPSHEPPGEAVKFGIPTFDFLEFKADWDGLGRRAGFVRNTQMLEEGKPNLVIAFAHDFENSKGTRMMIDIARKAFVETYVVE